MFVEQEFNVHIQTFMQERLRVKTLDSKRRVIHFYIQYVSVGVRVQLLCWTDIHTLICVLNV